MKVRFLNPVEQVSGSCYWLKDDQLGVELLVDCGMAQGEHDARAWNTRAFEFEPAKLTGVFLTHAHLDHCGLLPRLARDGFSGPVWCTRETAELARLSLLDAAGHRGALYGARDVEALKFREPRGQVFGRLHPLAHDVFFAFYRSAHIVGGVAIQIRWGPKPIEGKPDLQRAITFSGDLGCNEEGREHLPLLRHRMNPFGANYAVIESTYGATVRPPEHHDFDARIERLRVAIDRALFERQGHVLVPCFSIDRTQTVLFDLHYIVRRDPERYAGVPIFLTAPQAVEVNAIYARALIRKEPIQANKLKSLWMNKRLFDWLAIERTPEGERQLEAELTRMLTGSVAGNNNSPWSRDRATDEISQRQRPREGVLYSTYDKPSREVLGDAPWPPSIVVTGGGMCEGGMVLAYFDRLLRDARTTVLFTGYLPPSTVGGQILAHGKLPVDERSRASEALTWRNPDGSPHSIPLCEVRAEVEQVTGYSGHADQRGLLSWLFAEEPSGRRTLAGRTVFITHGEDQSRHALMSAIEARSAEWQADGTPPVAVVLPTRHDRARWFDLDSGSWCDAAVAPAPDDRLAALEARVARLEELVARLSSATPLAG